MLTWDYWRNTNGSGFCLFKLSVFYSFLQGECSIHSIIRSFVEHLPLRGTVQVLETKGGKTPVPAFMKQLIKWWGKNCTNYTALNSYNIMEYDQGQSCVESIMTIQTWVHPGKVFCQR